VLFSSFYLFSESLYPGETFYRANSGNVTKYLSWNSFSSDDHGSQQSAEVHAHNSTILISFLQSPKLGIGAFWYLLLA
jgi:hypothetical protein